jgi:uncharacterized protein (TIRG00374 family)
MSPTDANHGAHREELDATLPMTAAESGFGAEPEDTAEEEPRFFEGRKRIVQTLLIAVGAVVAIYIFFPEVVGVEDGIEKLGEGDALWIGVALAFSLVMFASYVALFKGVVGGAVRLRWRESYQITMAGLAATRLFSAGGAGGIVLTYWALRKAGMSVKDTAARMVAFNVLLYAVYMVTLLVNGILLRTGVFSGSAPAGMTVVPATIAGGVILIFLLITLVPGDLEKRFSEASQERFWGRTARRLATVPSTLAVGTREALSFVREPSRGGLALIGAIGFWAAQIAILAAAFKAFDVEVSFAVIVQGFFVGMFANLLPLPGGVGGVDAGMIGAFVLFGLPDNTVFAAVLVYRVIAFWLPLVPGVIAFFQLRRTVRGWEQRPTSPPVGNDAAESLPGAITS